MRNKISRYFQAGFYLGLGLICLLLPFQPGFLTSVEIGTVLLFLLGFSPGFIVKNIVKQRFILPYFLLFALVAVWYFFSENQHEAGRQVEVKLSFLIIPILLIGSGLAPKKAERGIGIFVVANFISALFLLFYALFRYQQNGNAEVFFYTEFSNFHHVTYFSMYLLFSMGWLMMKGMEEYQNFPKIFVIPMLVFAVCIILASAKIMIIALTISIFFMAFYIARQKKTIYPPLILISVAVLLPVILYSVSDNFRLRVNYGITELTSSSENRNPERIGSTGLRMVVWGEALPIIRENIVWGIGPGTVQNELQKIYHVKKMEAAEKRKLNLHNEYLQQLAGNGIPGFFLFIILSLMPLLLAEKPLKFSSFLFGFIVLSAGLTESIMERQAGTLFIGLIGILLIIAYKKDSKKQDLSA